MAEGTRFSGDEERPVKTAGQRLGQLGEKYAIDWLHRHGAVVVERNFRTRRGEVDIIALRDDTILFVEVKSRRTLSRGLPQDAVHPFKIRRIRAAAEMFLHQTGRLQRPCRFDVAVVMFSGRCAVERFEYIENAF
jgi:putative endonuclease